MSITQFFHPLDLVADWNRVYGPKGFLQWQYVVPDSAGEFVRRSLEELSRSGVAPSFLAVLKRMGPGNEGHLSFPSAGWTLAFDAPVGNPELNVVDRLDEEVVGHGGRIYLAKDSRVNPVHMDAMYPRLGAGGDPPPAVDPDGRFQSDLARRLNLI